MAKDYMVYVQYYVAAKGKVIKSSEERYNDKHVHGAQPAPAVVERLTDELIAEVQQYAEAQGIAIPSADDIRSGTEVKTYTAR
jgi:predicted NBD/HSP70 family sugar kinase